MHDFDHVRLGRKASFIVVYGGSRTGKTSRIQALLSRFPCADSDRCRVLQMPNSRERREYSRFAGENGVKEFDHVVAFTDIMAAQRAQRPPPPTIVVLEAGVMTPAFASDERVAWFLADRIGTPSAKSLDVTLIVALERTTDMPAPLWSSVDMTVFLDADFGVEAEFRRDLTYKGRHFGFVSKAPSWCDDDERRSLAEIVRENTRDRGALVLLHETHSFLSWKCGSRVDPRADDAVAEGARNEDVHPHPRPIQQRAVDL